MALVLLLEFLRRLQREYDRFIIPSQQSTSSSDEDDNSTPLTFKNGTSKDIDGNGSLHGKNNGVHTEERPHSPMLGNGWNHYLPLGKGRYVPTFPQQVARAGIHTMQFSVAYFIMLLAMYYNGYIIVCIFIGVFIGFFIFSWDGSGILSM